MYAKLVFFSNLMFKNGSMLVFDAFFDLPLVLQALCRWRWLFLESHRQPRDSRSGFCRQDDFPGADIGSVWRSSSPSCGSMLGYHCRTLQQPMLPSVSVFWEKRTKWKKTVMTCVGEQKSGCWKGQLQLRDFTDFPVDFSVFQHQEAWQPSPSRPNVPFAPTAAPADGDCQCRQSLRDSLVPWSCNWKHRSTSNFT